MLSQSSHSVSLEVHPVEDDDAYRDIVRVARWDRGEIKAGSVCRFSTPKGYAYLMLRNTHNGNRGKILMDRNSLNKLNIDNGEKYNFVIREAGFWGELCWIWTATDPVYRVAGRLGVLSLVLGILAVLPMLEGMAAWGMRLFKLYV
ncbi:MAG: hypothetical protein KGI97_04070 [Alphaproteobacteria bacterium]|nr:hypothetical protein [Alphaproteobacteria bacterium]